LQRDMEKIMALGGSARYNNSAKEIALWLFCRFARDSEDKKALTSIEHKWTKRKPKRKGTGKAVKAKVVDQSNSEKVLEAVIIKSRTTEHLKHSGAVTEQKIQDLSRRELQDLAKRHKIRANQKSTEIVQQLMKRGNKPRTDHNAVQWTISDTEESEDLYEQHGRGVEPMVIDWEQEQQESESKHSHEPPNIKQRTQNNTDTQAQGDTYRRPVFFWEQAEKEKATEKNKLKNKDKQKRTAEKRKQQKETQEEERNTEKAGMAERRRVREEGRTARRNKRDANKSWHGTQGQQDENYETQVVSSRAGKRQKSSVTISNSCS
jgi:hypothetical protein